MYKHAQGQRSPTRTAQDIDNYVRQGFASSNLTYVGSVYALGCPRSIEEGVNILLTDGILTDDTYRLFVPIADDDLLKSVQIDENGDYIVQGVMSSEDKDEEDDSITPEGMDCSYFLDKGWIKYEHGNNPNQFIGEPLEVKVGQFEHPTKHSLVKGIHVKARLFAQRELARQAVKALEDLQKSKTSRKMGWSIEGNVKERDRKTGKIVKSILRNVVLTMNPVNTMTWAELAKSFAKNHELTIDMEKAMDLGATEAVNRQSLEGAPKEQDEQEKWLKLFREFAKNNFLHKSLRTKFVNSPQSVAGMTAYNYALKEGLDNEDAYEFASYIAERHEVLKSLFRANFGGEKMSKLASIIDADLEELQKSLDDENLENNEELEKSIENNEEGSENDPDNDGDDKKDNDDDGDGKEDNEDDEETEKSLKTEFSKSLAADDEGTAQAFEVSEFLRSIADQIGFSMDGIEKSMNRVTKQQNAIVNVLNGLGELTKSLIGEVETLKEENTDLKKSLNDLLEKPVGRKSAVNTREVATIQKSIGGQQTKQLTRADVSDILMKSFEAGEIGGMTVSRFEAGVPLQDLRLPKSVTDKLGL